MSALRFHLCNLPSIVRDYYQLLNNSDDIYQGQLYRAVSCRENGLSVLLLHSGRRVRCWGCSSGGRNLWLDLFLLRECPRRHKNCHKLSTIIEALRLTSWAVLASFDCHGIPVKHSLKILAALLSLKSCSNTITTVREDWSSGLTFLVMMHHIIVNKKAEGYSEAPWSSARGKSLSLSFLTRHLHPVQVDTEFMETKDFVSSLCLSISLMCSPDWGANNSGTPQSLSLSLHISLKTTK